MANKKVQSVIHADGIEIAVVTTIGNEDDYISLTDMARHRNPEFPADVVKNWLRLRSTLEFLGLWEQLNNPDFKLVEFDQFKNEAGSNAFVMSPQKWIKETNAIGLVSKSGRYGGGTYKLVQNFRQKIGGINDSYAASGGRYPRELCGRRLL